MYSLSQSYHRARSESAAPPMVLFRLTNAYGVRVYADRAPTAAAMGHYGAVPADGSALADGSWQAGCGEFGLLDSGGLVLSYGCLRETLTPFSGSLLAGLQQEEPAGVTVVLSNESPDAQRPMSRLEAMENLLGARGELVFTYPGVRSTEALVRFGGRVESYAISARKLSLSLRAA